jgi:hypothetical protein
MNNTADYAYFLMLGTAFMTAVSERIGWLQHSRPLRRVRHNDLQPICSTQHGAS